MGYGLPGFSLPLRFFPIEPVESKPVSPAPLPADDVAAGWVERVVPSDGLLKRCALFGSISAGSNGLGIGLRGRVD